MSGEKALRQHLLEETDGAPGGADGAGYEGRIAEDGGGEAVECCDRRTVEGFVGGDIEDEEDGREEAG